MVYRICLNDELVCWFLKPSSKLIHILMTDGIHGFNETFVRVNVVEKSVIISKMGTPNI